VKCEQHNKLKDFSTDFNKISKEQRLQTYYTTAGFSCGGGPPATGGTRHPKPPPRGAAPEYRLSERRFYRSKDPTNSIKVL